MPRHRHSVTKRLDLRPKQRQRAGDHILLGGVGSIHDTAFELYSCIKIILKSLLVIAVITTG